MKTTLLAVAGFLGILAFSSRVEARNNLPEIAVRELCQNSASGPYLVNVSSHLAVNVASSTVNGAMAGAFFIEVYNNSATVTLNCSFDASVATVTTSGYYGREIPPKVGVGFSADFDKLELYCMSQGANATSAANIFQCR